MDEDGILLIDYLPKGQTISTEYYLSLLAQLKYILREKCHRKVTKGFLFLRDSVPAHRELTSQKKLAYMGLRCLDHPPFSPDLASLDYHLFPGLKKQFKGHHFSSDVEFIAAVETWLDRQPSEFFFEWLAKFRAVG
jgi:histone-lysine N-methyltransferase SETMAR